MKHLRFFTKHSLSAKILSCVLAVAISFTVPLPKTAHAAESNANESVTSAQNSADATAQNVDGQDSGTSATQEETKQSDADKGSQEKQAEDQSSKADTTKDTKDTSKKDEQTTEETTDKDKDVDAIDNQLSNAQDNSDSLSSSEVNEQTGVAITYLAPTCLVYTEAGITFNHNPGSKADLLNICNDGQDSVYFIDQWTFSSDGGTTPDWKPSINLQLRIHGNVTLVIADGMEITINKKGAEDSKGRPAINVEGDANALTITAGKRGNVSKSEIQGTGTLLCYSGKYAAAIGGNNEKNGQNITINACHIEAHSAWDVEVHGYQSWIYGGAAAIGGGAQGKGFNININGGYVKAIDHSTIFQDDGGAGIGSGSNAGDYGPGEHWYDKRAAAEASGAWDINITGGEVYAQGGSQAAGIGGGYMSSGHHITISGGKVTAVGTDGAAGIGAGHYRHELKHTNKPHGYDILISGGEVKAYGGDSEDSSEGRFGGAGIGSGDAHRSYALKITGGTVDATPGPGAAAIGGGEAGAADCIEICGDARVTTHEAPYDKNKDRYTGIGSGINAGCGQMRIYGNAYIVAHGDHGAAIGSGGNDGTGSGNNLICSVWCQ